MCKISVVRENWHLWGYPLRLKLFRRHWFPGTHLKNTDFVKRLYVLWLSDSFGFDRRSSEKTTRVHMVLGRIAMRFFTPTFLIYGQWKLNDYSSSYTTTNLMSFMTLSLLYVLRVKLFFSSWPFVSIQIVATQDTVEPDSRPGRLQNRGAWRVFELAQKIIITYDHFFFVVERMYLYKYLKNLMSKFQVPKSWIIFQTSCI